MASAIAASIVASAAGAEKPSSGAAMSNRSTRRLNPNKAKKATLPMTIAARPFAGRLKIFRSRASGVTIASSIMVTQAASDMRPGSSEPRAASHSKLMPKGSANSVSASVSAAIRPASSAAVMALPRRPACAAKKLVASSRNANAAPGDIGAKSAPKSRNRGTPSTHPHSDAAPSTATMP